MRREIRFRVWCKKHKKFLTEMSLYDYVWMDYNTAIEENKKYNIPGVSLREALLDNDHKFTVQQFSGVYDKNNKAIYEGDILELCTGQVGEVYFASGAFLIKNIDCLWCAVKDGVCEDYEIIGNIHENSELLKT